MRLDELQAATTLLGKTGDVVKIVGGVVALAGFSWGLYTYRASVNTRRAEWLSKLHETFFGGDRYSEIRRVLDYRIEPAYSRLVSAVCDGRHDPLADELYRYLNFFEFLAGLRELDQITNEEITGLFDYDLRLLAHHDFIMRALEPEGFEKLAALLASRAQKQKA
ncbi:MAG TPA: hypothetical protein VHB25_06695 [Gemmatimonadaceae bacterium]|nr:hypothetical protein [Gemmatimonadaceae bacterium]